MVTSAQFLALLKQSQLVPADELARSSTESSAQELAQGYIARGSVTRWQAEQLLAGKHQLTLGKYRLLDKLGEGGMGAVYKASQMSTGRLVAIKLMTENVVKQPGALQRFQREIRAASALDHPNIVTALDADQVGNLHFLVMEYAEGRDLKEWIKEFGRLPIDWSCECIRQAALGLQHADERGLAHRDIKPSNLLVIEDSSGGLPLVKILDMGLARFTSEVQCTVLTQTGQVLGTIDYISPEQAKDTKGAGIVADIFSLGASLFHMLTGQVPFGGKSPMEKLMARAVKDAPRARTLRPDIPAAVDETIARMLARKVEDRYQTPAEVVAALAPYCLGAVDAQPSSSLTLPKSQSPGSTIGEQADATLDQFLNVMESGSESPPLSPPEPRSTATRSTQPTTARWLALAAGIGALALVGILWMTLGRGSREVASKGGVTPKPKLDPGDKPSRVSPPPPASTQVASGKRGLTDEQQAFVDQTSKLPMTAQLVAVRQKLLEINPGFEGTYSASNSADGPWISKVILAENKQIKAIWPFRAFLKLTDLDVHDTSITSVESLRGLKLTRLDVGQTDVSDLSPLEGMPLERLAFYFTPVSDLKPLKGMPLTKIDFWATRVGDLSPLAEMPLSDVTFGEMPQITSLEGLKGLKLTELNCSKSKASDLEPLRGMPLTSLGCGGLPITTFEPLRGMPLKKISAYSTNVTDLTPLTDLPLTDLWLNNTPVVDLKPLAGLKLGFLNLRGAKQVKDLTPLAGMPLRTLWITDTPVESLEPLRGMALTNLECRGSAVTNLSPLEGMSLKELSCEDSVAWKHAPMLKGMNSLTKLNRMTPEAFWARPQGPAGGASPEQEEFVARVAKLPAADQVRTVIAKLQEVNPGFRGSLNTKVTAGGKSVYHVELTEDKTLAVVWPLRAFEEVTELDLSGAGVSDVSSLAGLKLKVCNLSGTKVTDLSGLGGMPLEILKVNFTKVASLASLAGAPLVELRASGTPVESLEPLREAKLTLRRLSVYQTRVTDLEPLTGMQLEHLDCGEGQVASLEPLRGMPLTLLYLNNCAVKDLAPLAGMPLVELQAMIGVSALPKFKDGTLKALDVSHSKISGLSSLANQPNLESLRVEGTLVTDLAALATLPKLVYLNVSRTQVADLTPLNGKKLTWFACHDTQVTNLSALAGMPLVELHLGSIPVDLGPLAPLPLKALSCDAAMIRKHAKTIQQIKSLQQLNGMAVAEFWKKGD